MLTYLPLYIKNKVIFLIILLCYLSKEYNMNKNKILVRYINSILPIGIAIMQCNLDYVVILLLYSHYIVSLFFCLVYFVLSLKPFYYH